MGMGARRVSLGIWVASVAAVAAVAAVALALAPAAAATVEPYGTHDAGGFRNVLPPGEAGTDNAAQLAQFQLDGSYPDHFTDQQPLYDSLITGSPNLTNAQIPQYYKDATFGVKPNEVESTESPEPGLTIVRDKKYGIPHIYGKTRAEVMFGQGYAGAEDRLFLMDILRHTGRAELSSFIGGSPSNRAMDHVQWQLAPYTEHDLQTQIDRAGEFYGAEGVKLVNDVHNYVDGINAYISEALTNPNLLPAEYAALGNSPLRMRYAVSRYVLDSASCSIG